MKAIPLAVTAAFILSLTMPASAQRKVCNHDPVCQAERDGITVAEVHKRNRAYESCLRAVGYTLADWRAYSVPQPQADKVRACFRRNGLRD